MDNKLLLAQSVILLHRESKMIERSDNSVELIRTVLRDVKVSDLGIGITTDRDIIGALKVTILEMCGNPQDHNYDNNSLLQRIRLNCAHDEKLYEVIREGVESTFNEEQLKKSVLYIRHSLNNHFKEQTIGNNLKQAYLKWNYERDSILDINQFLAQHIAQLEPLHINGQEKDEAVLGEIDIGDDSAMNSAYMAVQAQANGSRVYKTGWQDLNTALNGGLRVETTVLGALQHKYKSGGLRSLFAQVATNNTPFITEAGKKPLLLYISFEDTTTQCLQFMYQYLKHDETLEYVSVKDTPVEEMTAFVKARLQATGFHVKMMSVDPGKWTYKSLCNKIIALEAQGYAVEMVMTDYLSKISTMGCSFTTTGSEYLDLLSKVRHFMAAREIAFVTPWQFSTEAKKQLELVAPEKFVTTIAEKGMWEHTKGLDRIYDCALLFHKFTYSGKTYWNIYHEKHRGQVVDEDLKYMLFEFPKRGMPIPSDISREKLSFRRLKSAPSNAPEELFSFG